MRAALVAALIALLRKHHGDALFSEDGSRIDDQIARLLAGRRIATAESCTGGLLAARLTEIHVHDEWTRKKFDEGRYKSSEIYGSPKDPALKKEYEEYLKRRLAEVKGRQGAAAAPQP